MTINPAILDWLMAQGGAVARWLTATQLLPEAGYDLDVLQHDLLASEAVRTWLPRLVLPDTFDGWHGSRSDAFENVGHKLAELGLRAGMAELDQRIDPVRAWLAHVSQTPPFAGFMRVLASAVLARLGYQDAAISQVLQAKLDAMHVLAASGRHDIYVALGDYDDIPTGRQGIPLVDPALTSGAYSQLPSIHALYGLAFWPAALDTPANRMKRDAVLDYILNDDYQHLRDGYGLMRAGPRRYYAIGWSVHLPGWGGFPPIKPRQRMTMQRLELMSRYERARATDWYARALAHMDCYRDDEGRYDLPAAYLSELKAGYYVSGASMGLESGRRTSVLRRLEGTLRMLRLARYRDLAS